jgi:polyisoprenyl-phosphate glycosyltransferase
MEKEFYIVTPCYNDFESLYILLENIDRENEKYKYNFSVIVINDASLQENPFIDRKFENIKQILQIDLIKNVGHQRAIASGLSHINSNLKEHKNGAVIVMDCDGEDDYLDIFNFVNKYSDDKILFAKRKKRSESLLFIVFYIFYKFIFKLLTGKVLQSGNFSIIPLCMLNKVVNIDEIWNHYCAGILKSKLLIEYLSCNRSTRYKGKSKMNFSTLVLHGLSSISVFNEIVFVRLTIFSCIFIVLSILISSVVLIAKFCFNNASPGWVTTVIGIVLIMCVQFLTIVITSTFLVLEKRSSNPAKTGTQ